MKAPNLSTERLVLRQWTEEDLPLFAELNGDKRVMEHFPSTLSRQESDSLAEMIREELRSMPYGLWAVEIKDAVPFIGFVGLHKQDFPASFTPCIEIGWRIAYEYWGKGYAFEAASKVIDYAFKELQLDDLVSFTAVENLRSQRLMAKLKMSHDIKDDFEHPKLPIGHRLRPHVLYRLNSKDFFNRVG